MTSDNIVRFFEYLLNEAENLVKNNADRGGC